MRITIMLSIILIAGCLKIEPDVSTASPPSDTVVVATVPDSIQPDDPLAFRIHTAQVEPEEVVDFAKKQIGIPYRYGSTNPSLGFDCSGFITYVFNYFDIRVPRSSVDFTNVGKEVNKLFARPGDLILFTGTDSTIRRVGHMGIVISNENGQLEFIHSSSGKAYGVTTTPLNSYYMGRFVKVIRIFPQNDI